MVDESGKETDEGSEREEENQGRVKFQQPRNKTMEKRMINSVKCK